MRSRGAGHPSRRWAGSARVAGTVLAQHAAATRRSHLSAVAIVDNRGGPELNMRAQNIRPMVIRATPSRARAQSFVRTNLPSKIRALKTSKMPAMADFECKPRGGNEFRRFSGDPAAHRKPRFEGVNSPFWGLF